MWCNHDDSDNNNNDCDNNDDDSDNINDDHDNNDDVDGDNLKFVVQSLLFISEIQFCKLRKFIIS